MLDVFNTTTRELGIKPPLKVQKFRQICGSTIFHQIWEFFSSSSIFGQIWSKFSGASIFLQNFEHFLLIYTVNPYYFGTFFHQIWPFLGCSYFWPNLIKIFGSIYFSPKFWSLFAHLHCKSILFLHLFSPKNTFLGCSYFWPNLIKIFGCSYFSPNPQNLGRVQLL